jgi:hypothetical protein
MVTAGIFPFKENSHGTAGNRTRDRMVSSQRLWSLAHEAGLLLNIISGKSHFPFYNIILLQSTELPIKKTSSFKRADCSNELTWQRMGTQNEWKGPRERVRPWGSGVGSAVHCSGVTSDNGPVVNGPAVTSRNCVLDPRKNETLDVVTSKNNSSAKELRYAQEQLYWICYTS